MDIRTQLLKGNSRANAESVATYVGSDQGRFRILMQCMLDDDRRTGQLASHSVAIVCDTHPDLAVPYLGRLLGTLDAPVHEAVQRNSIRIMQRLQGHKRLIQGNHDRVKGKLRPYWESIEQYAEVNDENRLVILSHYPILFYKNQHYGAVMLYGHVHNTSEWELVEKWKKEQWAMGIPSRLINVGCMMDYMRYTPRTLTELLDANPMPEIARDRKDGSAVERAEQQDKRERTWDLNEGYTAEKTE